MFTNGPLMSLKFISNFILMFGVLYLPTASAMEGTDGYKLPRPAISSDFPYESQFVSVLGSNMHYVEVGEGDPILFLHGNPTSSYLWRNILPFTEPFGQSIAVDLIGMGQSDKPDIDYTFSDHYRYIESFIDALELRNITLVVHDWGAAIGFNYARTNPGKVKAIAFMESMLPPIFPVDNIDEMPTTLREFFTTLRDPVMGPELIINQNYFIEEILPSSINRPLTDAEMSVYRAPYPDESSRLPIWVWPNQVPIENEPESTTRVLSKIERFMTSTRLPMLMLYASPGAIVSEAEVSWYTANVKNIETQFIGQSFHYVQEDQPEAIGRAIADWLRRLEKRGR